MCEYWMDRIKFLNGALSWVFGNGKPDIEKFHSNRVVILRFLWSIDMKMKIELYIWVLYEISNNYWYRTVRILISKNSVFWKMSFCATFLLFDFGNI